MGRRQFGAWEFYAYDPQGSVAQRTDASGTVLANQAYDAYGAESSTGTPAERLGFNARWGYLYDRDLGLYYCQNRYYDPGNGRWLTRDPIGFAGGINLYGYCASGPVGAIDPSGLAFWIFNGYDLILISDDGTRQKPVKRFPAYSGMGKSTPEDVKKPNHGPIPPGKYSVSPTDIGRNGNINWPGPAFDDDYNS